MPGTGLLVQVSKVRIRTCTSSSSGGNQVDGLPPAAHTGAGVIGQSVARDKSVTGHPMVRSTLLQAGTPSGAPIVTWQFCQNHVIFTPFNATCPTIETPEHPIFQLQNYNRCVRKFLPPPRHRTFICSLTRGWIPVSDLENHGKSIFIKVIRDASGDVRESREIF